MKVHLTLIRPDQFRFKIMDSHLEVINSLQWGLQACGIECSVGVNNFAPDRQNIVFGWIVAAQLGLLDKLSPDTILYNFEQYSERELQGTRFAELAQRFRIWDYNQANVERWKACNPRFEPFYAPVSYAPSLSSIAPAAVEDIDALYIGSVGPNRRARLDEICASYRRSSVVSLSNVWGATRDEFIARSRLLLNISADNPQLRIFEIVRVSYYLANRKAVVCEAVEGQLVEPDMREALLFASRAELPDLCDRLLDDAAQRREVAERGFAAFARRDVRDVVRAYFR